eukprot:CAMPEP_0171241712 /NCGR_PEP_ID=MMETSP0790-20130122/45248_1 /TAXON_ID=2925 /ORGANISM="Alexandrium catenella, Strain OF101" /LENGTH=54 /DNA_ID=CAMNT_0011708353 /DNA_START=120 /DNA_END=280 /DNA_ORIENTATION=-
MQLNTDEERHAMETRHHEAWLPAGVGLNVTLTTGRRPLGCPPSVVDLARGPDST